MGIFVFFFSVKCILAIPPILDHFWPFKNGTPPYSGPVSEKVVSAEGEAVAYYQYNPLGQVERATYFRNSKKEGESFFEYFEQKLKKESLYDAQGKLVERINYQYNDRGELIGYQVLSGSGEELLSWKFVNHNGEIVSGERFVGKELTESFRLEKGRPLKQILFDGAGTKQGEILYIKENGLLKERLKVDFTGKRKVVYTYDNLGRLRQMTFYRQEQGEWERIKVHEFFYP